MVERYKVTLQADERAALEAITRKGSHRSRKVINALILLNCDEGAFNQRRVPVKMWLRYSRSVCAHWIGSKSGLSKRGWRPY